jgi:hypothetical protein
MGQGAADALRGGLVPRGEDVVHVARVESRVLGRDLVGPSPAGFVRLDPGALFGGEIRGGH